MSGGITVIGKVVRGEKMEQRFEHICEVCGTTKVMTPQEAFEKGWDYPPIIGSFGVISPRTCGNCLITETAWWALACDKKQLKDLSNKQQETMQRILKEPIILQVQ